MSEDYTSDDEEIPTFCIYDNIIDRKDDNTFMIKMKFRDFLAYTNCWCFNRKVCQDKVDELYKSLCVSYDVPFIIHAVYDDKHSDVIRKLLILDGQHRREAIKKYIENEDKDWTCLHYIWMCVYKIPNAESDNTNKVLELFKKINNNRIFSQDELPDTFVMDLVKAICNVPIFKKNKVIGTNNVSNICHSPCIHKKELNILFNMYRDTIINNGKTIQEIVENIQMINHKISIKTYDELYYTSYKVQERQKYQKAVAKGFFLNLKNSRYTPDIWIKFINNPELL